MTWSCAHKGCSASAKKSAWDNIAAQESGWFFQKDDIAWCPDHVPDWVAEWRIKK